MDKVRLLTRGHYVYALGYYDGRQGNPADEHFKDQTLRELYSLGFASGMADNATFDKD